MLRNKIFIRIMAIIALAAFIITCVCVVIPPLRSGAASVSEAQRQQQQAQQKIKDAESWQSKEIQKRTELDKQITAVQTQINKYADDINEKNKAIEECEEKIRKLSQDLIDQNEAYMERAKMLIQKGNISYLEILLNSKSVEDMLSRISIVKWVAEYDSKKLEEIEDSMAEVEKLNEELVAKKAEVLALKEEQDSKKAELEGYRQESQDIIDELQKNIELFEQQYEAAKQAEQKARQAAQAALSQAQAGSGSFTVPQNFVGGKFLWPSNSSYLVTSPYGYRVHPVMGVSRFHSGIDIGAAYGTDILAANSGTVIVAGYNSGGYGNYVVISHGGGYTTLYAHASSLCVSKGQTVTKGQVIAKCGSTGMSTGPHIHFEVQLNGKTTDPMGYYR